MTVFNINSRVKVKLNKQGHDIYYHQYDDLNRAHGNIVLTPEYAKTDEFGYSCFQMWDLMRLFGSHIDLQYEPPFDTNILLDELDLENKFVNVVVDDEN